MELSTSGPGGNFINLVFNHASVTSSPGLIIAGPFFDTGRQKLLYAKEDGFYWFDPFVVNSVTAITLAYKFTESWPLNTLQPILSAALSLDSQIVAIQRFVR